MVAEHSMSRAPRPSVPLELGRLVDLALDVRWTWSHAADALWRRVDAELWAQTGNPWLMLQFVPAARLRALAADAGFLEALDVEWRRWRSALDSATWFADAGHRDDLVGVAYFSMEFGLHEALPLYAGGLGILAGDHVKTASDVGVPLIGVGILWQHGYFRQMLDPAGRQLELVPYTEPAMLPVKPLMTPDGDPVEVALDLPGRPLRLRCWEVTAGRAKLLLLDANHPLNRPLDRGLTAGLYGSDGEIRLLQELILGIGGWRLLRTLGIKIDVCHLNEGHAAFVIIERARTFMEEQSTTFREALWATRAGNVFTTHTAVAAGFDNYGPELISKYSSWFDDYVRRLGVSWADVLRLGRADPANAHEPFGMANLAMRGAAHVNAVSRLHGAVSRRLFQRLFPRWPECEVPVSHVTNGVHVPSWDSPWADVLWTDACGRERWRGGLIRLDEGIGARPDVELWSLRNHERADVVRLARTRLRQQLSQRGVTGVALNAADVVLEPHALTLGFARRFTGYKRPNLLLADPARLRRLLTNQARPVQLLVGGKAHPADDEGKRMIAEWARFAADPEVRSRVVFIEDYDMIVARELVQGVDVWLNTPRRPWEACGTSGMKVLANGGLNLSSLDGWWAEAEAPDAGWTLPDRPDDLGRDDADAAELYRILEDEVVPCFYDRDEGGIPRRWLQRMRRSMASLTPRFSSNRMLREYVESVYLPAARECRVRSADNAAVARALAAWECRLEEHWHTLAFVSVDHARCGDGVRVSAVVCLGALMPGDVRIEVFADPVGGEAGVCVPMMATKTDGGVACQVQLSTTRPPNHFTPRIVPAHPHALRGEVTYMLWPDSGG
jgi:glycogen phosphorylase